MTGVLGRISALANRGTEWVLAPLVMFFTALMLTAVFTRYVLDVSMVNATELTRIAFCWSVFLGAAAATHGLQHVRVTFLADQLPPRGQAALMVLVHLAALGFGLVMVVEGWGVAERMAMTFLPTTGWSQAWIYGAVPVSGALIVLHAAAAAQGSFQGIRRGTP